jgi:hypothetical protein
MDFVRCIALLSFSPRSPTRVLTIGKHEKGTHLVGTHFYTSIVTVTQSILFFFFFVMGTSIVFKPGLVAGLIQGLDSGF